MRFDGRLCDHLNPADCVYRSKAAVGEPQMLLLFSVLLATIDVVRAARH